MNAQDVISRACTMQGRRTVYWPGFGGQDPTQMLASELVKPALIWAGLTAAQQTELEPLAVAAGIDFDDRGAVRPACDCSGFVCWALGISRRRSDAASWTTRDGWINTDSIWQDATGPQGAFIRLSPDALRVGALLVHKKPPDGPYGHVGIVTAVMPSGDAAQILHCSADNFKSRGDAIAETDASAFDDPALQSVGAWYRSLDVIERDATGGR